MIEHEYNKKIEDMPVSWNPRQKLKFAKVCIRTVAEKMSAGRKRQEATEEELIKAELETAS